MSASGAGRGRGWLNLNKNATIRPGDVPPGGQNRPQDSINNDSKTQDLKVATLNLQLYSRLFSILEQLDPNDDGILLNQKLRNILQNWQQECDSAADVEASFKQIYLRCLQDASLATKVVTMVSSYSFITAAVYGVKIRNLFIAHIQNDFENSKHLQMIDPSGFRNSVRMLGEFYHKARLADGRIIKFLATPIMRYFDMLLESAQPYDLELFTSQLYLNGSAIKTDCYDKLQEVLMQVRNLLLNNTSLTPKCRVWMMLALDVVYHRFGLLPTDLQKFYREHLGDTAMANFQGTHGALSIQTTYSNKSLDGYLSSVSVLQVTPPESTSPVGEPPNNTHAQFGLSDSLPSFNNFNSEGSNEWDGAKDNKGANNREKVGRPILGAGARLQRNREMDSEWREYAKEMAGGGGSGGWDSKQKMGGKDWGAGSGGSGGGGGGGGSGAKKGHGGGNKTNKGWEHDDRFENDY